LLEEIEPKISAEKTHRLILREGDLRRLATRYPNGG
jgi:hypothetical protein